MSEEKWLYRVSDDLELQIIREDGRFAVLLKSNGMSADGAEPGMVVIEADEIAPLAERLMEIGMKHNLGGGDGPD
jgi:hypothetical protein